MKRGKERQSIGSHYFSARKHGCASSDSHGCNMWPSTRMHTRLLQVLFCVFFFFFFFDLVRNGPKQPWFDLIQAKTLFFFFLKVKTHDKKHRFTLFKRKKNAKTHLTLSVLSVLSIPPLSLKPMLSNPWLSPSISTQAHWRNLTSWNGYVLLYSVFTLLSIVALKLVYVYHYMKKYA